MNRVAHPLTKEFIAACLLSFNSIDTYFQAFRYLFPCISFTVNA